MTDEQESATRRIMAAWAARPRRGVIFDFNGTLSDDEPILLDIFSELFTERLGRTLTAEEYYGRLAGMSDREIIAAVVGEVGPGDDALVEELLRLRAERYLARVDARSPVATGTAALVARLAAAAVPIAVVTGAQRAEVQHVLNGSPVGPHIHVLVTEEDVTRGKPDPEGFLIGADLLQRQPDEILVFEDSVPGLLAAQAAGMPCIAVARAGASSMPVEAACGRVSSLAPRLLDSLPGF